MRTGKYFSLFQGHSGSTFSRSVADQESIRLTIRPKVDIEVLDTGRGRQNLFVLKCVLRSVQNADADLSTDHASTNMDPSFVADGAIQYDRNRSRVGKSRRTRGYDDGKLPLSR